MSNFHILTQALSHKSVSVVFHIPIPSSNNSVGITWQQAVVKWLGGADNIVSVLPDITTQEESDIKSGALYELVKTVKFSSINLTNAQRLQEIRDEYTVDQSEFVLEKQITLDFIGYEGNV